MARQPIEYQTLQTVVSTTEHDAACAAAMLRQRAADLDELGRRGFELASTVTIERGGLAAIVDTLTRAANAESEDR